MKKIDLKLLIIVVLLIGLSYISIHPKEIEVIKEIPVEVIVTEKIVDTVVVEKVIEKVVPKKIIEYVQEKDGGCGCAERKAALNKLF